MTKNLKNALIFFIGTFIITWAFYFPIPLLGMSPYKGTGVILLIIGGSVPSWFGFIMAMATYDKAQRREYLQRIYQVKRIKLVWWLALLLLFPAIVAVTVGLDSAFGAALPGMANLKAIIANPVLWFPLVGLSFMSGPFSEELGWRGFALSPLLERLGFTKGTTILGLLWGVWHLPLFFMPETWHGKIGFQLTGFWMFLLFSVGLSYIMSWVFINTKRSILAAMLVHLSSNFTAQLIAGADGITSPRFEVFRSLLVAIIGISIAVYMIRSKKDAASNYTLLTASYESTIIKDKSLAVE